MKNDIAVIIIDMQDFFLKNFPASISSELIENQKKVINLCQRKKMPFILLEYKAGGILRGGTISEIENVISNLTKETIIKDSNGGFTRTNLDETLKKLQMKTILLMGLNANGCIQDTAIGAIHRGYKVITSEGIIGSSSRKDITLSKRNKKWFKQNADFFENPDELIEHLKNSVI